MITSYSTNKSYLKNLIIAFPPKPMLQIRGYRSVFDDDYDSSDDSDSDDSPLMTPPLMSDDSASDDSDSENEQH